jgi:hypothetical protein
LVSGAAPIAEPDPHPPRLSCASYPRATRFHLPAATTPEARTFKTELIADRVWRTRSQLELAIVGAVCQVPSSLAGLLSLLSGCLTQPSFETFGMLVVGSVARVHDGTVCGMLQAAGLAGEWHHSRAHDFFARRRWDPDELGMALLDFLVVTFLKAKAPIGLAVDDTLFGRSGKHVWGAHWTSPGFVESGCCCSSGCAKPKVLHSFSTSATPLQAT